MLEKCLCVFHLRDRYSSVKHFAYQATLDFSIRKYNVTSVNIRIGNIVTINFKSTNISHIRYFSRFLDESGYFCLQDASVCTISR